MKLLATVICLIAILGAAIYMLLHEGEIHSPISGEPPKKIASTEDIPSDMVLLAPSGGRRGFLIDRYEFPNKKGEIPMGNVNWYEALELCKKRGKRLCTAEEWTRACSGPEHNKFPYGGGYKKGICRTDLLWEEGPVKSGEYEGCATESGLYDMSGNLWEWTFGTPDGKGEMRILKGGSWLYWDEELHCAYELFYLPYLKMENYGFRCCQDVEMDQGPAIGP